MKLAPFISSPIYRFFLSRDNALSGIFLAAAIILGCVVAVIGKQVGWVGLAAAPALLFVMMVLIQPEIGLVAFVFIVVIQLTPVINNNYPGIPSPAFLLLGLLVFMILWRMVVYGDRSMGWKRASVIFVIIVFWLLSVLVAEDFGLAFDKFRKFAENALLVFVVLFFVQRPMSLRNVIWTLLAAGIFMATISIIQNLTSTYDNNYWGFGTWESSSVDGVSNHRLAGPFGNPNAYAQVLVMLVPLALDRLWHEKDPRFRLLAVWAFGACILAVFLTYSRNGFVTLLFTLGFLFVMRRPGVLPLMLSMILMLVLFQVLPASYTDRITTLFQFSSSNSLQQVSDESFRGRLSENIAAWRMFQDHPLLGVGLDNFQVNYQNYSRQIGLDPRRVERTPASFYLELLAEQGLIGTTIFISFLVMVFWTLWKSRLRFQSIGMVDEAYMALAFMSGLAGYMVFYVSKNSSYSNVFWLLLGIALSIGQIAESSVGSFMQRLNRPFKEKQ